MRHSFETLSELKKQHAAEIEHQRNNSQSSLTEESPRYSDHHYGDYKSPISNKKALPPLNSHQAKQILIARSRSRPIFQQNSGRGTLESIKEEYKPTTRGKIFAKEDSSVAGESSHRTAILGAKETNDMNYFGNKSGNSSYQIYPSKMFNNRQGSVDVLGEKQSNYFTEKESRISLMPGERVKRPDELYHKVFGGFGTSGFAKKRSLMNMNNMPNLHQGSAIKLEEQNDDDQSIRDSQLLRISLDNPYGMKLGNQGMGLGHYDSQLSMSQSINMSQSKINTTRNSHVNLDTQNSQNDQTSTINPETTNTRRSKKTKQELCQELRSISGLGTSKSKAEKIYILSSSASKGGFDISKLQSRSPSANVQTSPRDPTSTDITQGQKKLMLVDNLNSYVNHSVRISKQRKKQVETIDNKLTNFVTPGKHKDSISRLSEALLRNRTERKEDEIQLNMSGTFKTNEKRLPLKKANMASNQSLGGKTPDNYPQISTTSLNDMASDINSPSSRISRPSTFIKGFSKKSSKDLSKLEVLNKIEEYLPLFDFTDNLVANKWTQLSFEQKIKYSYKMNQVSRLFQPQFPYIMTESLEVRRASDQESPCQGFWTKMLHYGGQMPQSRENASMVSVYIMGQEHLILVGGTQTTFGSQPFLAYAANLNENSWKSFELAPGNQKESQNYGTRPIIELNQDDLSMVTCTQFSGLGIEKMNGAMKISNNKVSEMCLNTDDFTATTSNFQHTSTEPSIMGRQHHGVNATCGWLLATGGVDPVGRHQSDFVIFEKAEQNWKKLPCYRIENDSELRNLAYRMQKTKEAEAKQAQLQRLGNKISSQATLSELSSKHDKNLNLVQEDNSLLDRSHHSMVSMKTQDRQLWDGRCLLEFKSLLFGGSVQNMHKQLVATNDLIVCTVKVITKNSFDYDATKDHIDVKSFSKELVDVVVTKKLETKGIQPVPRSDHTCIMIKNNSQMLIYGGRNDQGNLLDSKQTVLSDLMVLDIKTLTWTAIMQQGFLPMARWGAALAYNQMEDRIYVFGGQNTNKGACGNDVFVFDMKTYEVEQAVNKYKIMFEEVNTTRKLAIKSLLRQQLSKQDNNNQ